MKALQSDCIVQLYAKKVKEKYYFRPCSMKFSYVYEGPPPLVTVLYYINKTELNWWLLISACDFLSWPNSDWPQNWRFQSLKKLEIITLSLGYITRYLHIALQQVFAHSCIIDFDTQNAKRKFNFHPCSIRFPHYQWGPLQ